MAAGWEVADSFHLHTTVTGHVRIAKEPPPLKEDDPKLTTSESTQDPTMTDTPDATKTLLGAPPPTHPETQQTLKVEDLVDLERPRGELDSTNESRDANQNQGNSP